MNPFGFNDSKYNNFFRGAGGEAASLKAARLKNFAKLREEEEKQAAIEAAKPENFPENPGASEEPWYRKVAGGVGSTVKDGVVGTVGFVKDAGESAINLGETKGQLDQQSKFVGGKTDINKKYQDEADQEVWAGFEDAKDITELPTERQAKWNDIQERRKKEMAEFEKNTEDVDSDKLHKNLDRGREIEESMNKNAKKHYDLAQYIPGYSFGVEGLGTIAANIEGDEGDVNDALMKLTQGTSWDDMSDEEKESALKSRNIGAALSTLDFVPGVGKAVGSGAKTATKQGIKAGIKQTGKKFGESVLAKGVGEIAEVGAKGLLKQAGKSGATGAVVGSGLGAGLSAVMGGDIREGAIDGAYGGFIGGILGSPIDVNTKGAKNATFKTGDAVEGIVDDAEGMTKLANDLGMEEAKVKEALTIKRLKDESDAAYQARRKEEFDGLIKQREVENANMAETDPARLLEADNATPTVRPVAEVDAEIQKLQTEGDPNLSAAEAKTKFLDLQAERAIAEHNDAQRGFTTARSEEAQAFNDNGLPNDVAGSQKALDDVYAGKGLPTRRTQPIENVQQVIGNPSLPADVKKTAWTLMNDRLMVEKRLEGLMTDTKAKEVYSKLDSGYRARTSEIMDMPPQRQEIELEKLEQKYGEQIEQIDAKRAADESEALEYQNILEHLTSKEAEMVGDINKAMDENPDMFQTVDPEEALARVSTLESNLEQAKRFNGPDGIVKDVADSPSPLKTFEDTPEAPQAFKTKAVSEIEAMPNTEAVRKNFRHLGSLTEATASILSPSKWLEKMGLRNETIDMHTPVVQATAKLTRANDADIKVLQKISEMIPDNVEGQRQIVDFIEGKRQTLTAFTDREVAGQIQDFLKSKRVDLKKMGFETLDDYFPHVFDAKNKDTIRLFDPKATGEVSFGNLKSRLTGAEDYSTDIMKVLTDYTQGVNRKMILEPAIKPLADIRKQVDLSEGEAKLLDRYVKQLLSQDMSSTGKNFNKVADAAFSKMGLGDKVGSNHYGKALGTQRLVAAVGTMGLNPGTALRNMTQVVNTVTKLGPIDAAVGTIKGTKMLATEAGRAELTRAGILNSNVGRSEFMSLARPGMASKAGGAVDKATNGIMSLIEAGEVSMRSQAYAGAKHKALKAGLSVKQAEQAGIRAVVDTQFLTTAVDMPLKFNGQGVRSLAQFATFSAKQAEFLKESGIKVFKNSKGEWQFNEKQLAGILSGAVTAYAATEVLKPLMGFREEEWVPFYDQIAPYAFGDEDASGGAYRSPLVNLIAGDGKSKGGLLGLLSDARKGDFLENEDGDNAGAVKLWEDFWTQLVPAGTQMKKTYEGEKTTRMGESRKNGKIRFMQDTDPFSKTKANIFGQYSTDAGKDWIKEGFPSLSESQTNKVDQQSSPETKRKYADFYVARKKADGRQDAYSSAKEAVQEGDFNKAARVAQEYNSKVDEAMQEYWAQHEDMPEDLQDELLSSIYINIKTIKE